MALAWGGSEHDQESSTFISFVELYELLCGYERLRQNGLLLTKLVLFVTDPPINRYEIESVLPNILGISLSELALSWN
jgi:hypothetical protein